MKNKVGPVELTYLSTIQYTDPSNGFVSTLFVYKTGAPHYAIVALDEPTSESLGRTLTFERNFGGLLISPQRDS